MADMHFLKAVAGYRLIDKRRHEDNREGTASNRCFCKNKGLRNKMVGTCGKDGSSVNPMNLSKHNSARERIQEDHRRNGMINF
jgi:hypothetical protein